MTLLAVLALSAQVLAQSRPQAPDASETRPVQSSPTWTFAAAKDLFDGDESRRPSAAELMGRWKLEADLREPGSKDRLGLVKKLAKFEKVFATVSFEKPYDKTPGAATLTITAPAELFKGAAPLKPSMGIKLTPDARALAGRTSMSLRRFEGEKSYLTTDIDLKWAVSCRLSGADRLVCRTDWAYKVYHWDLDGSRCGVCDRIVAANGLFWRVEKGQNPKIRLDEKPAAFMVFSRVK